MLKKLLIFAIKSSSPAVGSTTESANQVAKNVYKKSFIPIAVSVLIMQDFNIFL